MKKRSKRIVQPVIDRKRAEELSHRILHIANGYSPRIGFLRDILGMIIEFSGCEVAELWLEENDVPSYCRVTRQTRDSFQFDMIPCEKGKMSSPSCLDSFYRDLLNTHGRASSPLRTKRGSLWTGGAEDADSALETGSVSAENSLAREDYPSFALIPLTFGHDMIGLLQLKSKERNHFSKGQIEVHEGIAQTLGIAVAHQKAQAALLERVKELTCLYGIAQTVADRGISLEEILKRIVELLPPAWQYPHIASARIVFDGKTYTTAGFKKCQQKQRADITVRGSPRGAVEAGYTQKTPDFHEGPFLNEERSLIDAVARQLALIIEQKETETDRSKLQDQLRHADRLATIGQLAAGVAHELNEPLSSILGFAQLTRKSPDLPKQIGQDIEKIVGGSLHAREIIKKLMLFARQRPPRKIRVNLNQVVEEGLYFLESRCTKAGIDLVRSLSTELPAITADPGQMNQVLVNLVVNSIQAMPEGGRLTVRTVAGEGYASLIVEDTGSGMSEKVKEQIFVPFFTTKDIDQGTGLGLPVVHGIVTSHNGSIEVESEVGSGTRFEIRLPIAIPQDQKDGQNGS